MSYQTRHEDGLDRKNLDDTANDIVSRAKDLQHKGMEKANDLRQRGLEKARDLQKQGYETLHDEAEHLRKGEIRQAPIISTAGGIAIALVLGIILTMYLRPNEPKQTTTQKFMSDAEHWFDNKYKRFEDLIGDRESINEKVQYTQDLLSSIGEKGHETWDQLASNDKYKNTLKHVDQWKKDLKTFASDLSNRASSSTPDLDETYQSWKNSLNRMKNDGLDKLIGSRQHWVKKGVKHGMEYIVEEIKYIIKTLLTTAIIGLVLFVGGCVLYHKYFPRQQDIHEPRHRN